MNNSLAKIDNTASKRKYYLVDFNGVKSEGLDGIEKLSADDNVVIFFGKSNDNVNFSVLSKLYSCKASIIMKEIENNDLMNLVIAVFIGNIINENPDIYLICKNGGNYIKAVELAVGRQINISVQQNISGVVTSQPTIPLTPPAPKTVPKTPFDVILSGFNLSRDCETDLKNCLNLLMKKSKNFSNGLQRKLSHSNEIMTVLNNHSINKNVCDNIIKVLQPYL